MANMESTVIEQIIFLRPMMCCMERGVGVMGALVLQNHKVILPFFMLWHYILELDQDEMEEI